MNQGEVLVNKISEVKLSLLKESIFISEEKVESYLQRFSSDKEKFDEYIKVSNNFNDILRANVQELHDNLEVFYSNEDELRAARKAANKLFNEHMEQIYNSDFIKVMFDKEQIRRKKEQEEKDRFIEVNNIQYEVVKKIGVLWSGWECDQYAYLVKTEDGLKLVTSDHGQMIFSETDFLKDKLAEYKEALSETEGMLKMLKD